MSPRWHRRCGALARIGALAALLGPLSAAAQPAPEAPGAAPAETPALPTLREEDRIARMLKNAEREGFERHELERTLAIYAPEAVWTMGRREAPDPHDVKLPLARLRALLRVRYRTPPSRREQVFFRGMKVEIAGDRATARTSVAHDLFSGREELIYTYALERRGGEWKVVAQRSWPTMRIQGGIPTLYTEKVWQEAEARAEKAMSDESTSLEARLFALTEAGQFRRAYELARARTVEAPGDARAWRARAMFGLEIGEVDDALLSARTAVGIDRTVSLPAMLLPKRAEKTPAKR